MNWQEKCVTALNAENMFDSSSHKSRFKELLDCYFNYPFFNKGLCKCMYLSAWDDEHFCNLLEMLSNMVLQREKDTTEMSAHGVILSRQQTDSEYYMYQLAVSFLENTPFEPDGDIPIDSKSVSIIGQALKAGEIIDRL